MHKIPYCRIDSFRILRQSFCGKFKLSAGSGSQVSQLLECMCDDFTSSAALIVGVLHRIDDLVPWFYKEVSRALCWNWFLIPLKSAIGRLDIVSPKITYTKTTLHHYNHIVKYKTAKVKCRKWWKANLLQTKWFQDDISFTPKKLLHQIQSLYIFLKKRIFKKVW